MSVREAEREVVAAAECVANSYRAYGGYTVPLSLNLRRLDDAVRIWQGFVREAMNEGSNSNGQSHHTTQPEAQRRQGCASASGSLAADAAQTATTPQQRARAS